MATKGQGQGKTQTRPVQESAKPAGNKPAAKTDGGGKGGKAKK